MAKEFIKFSEKKAVSRVLLSRFVKRIAAWQIIPTCYNIHIIETHTKETT
jgi:hypothetical protein